MNIQQLMYFQKVAQEESITKAADALYLTQPALSRAIGKLEEELGCELIRKSGRSIKLTEYGSALYKHANTILAEVKKLNTELGQLKSTKQKYVTIAAPTKLMQADLLERVYRIDPDIKINCLDRRAKDRTGEFLRGEIDLFVSEVPINSDELETQVLLKETLGVMMSRKHPLSGREEVSLFDLKNDDFVVYPKGRLIRDQFDELCEKLGIVPGRLIECESIVQAIPYVLTGRTVTIFPLWAIKAYEKENPLLRGVSLKENNYSKTLVLQWSASRQLNEAVTTVRDQIIEYYG